MLEFRISRVGVLLDAEGLLDGLDACCRDGDVLLLLVDDEVSRLCSLVAHHGLDPVELGRFLALLHGFCNPVAHRVYLRYVITFSRDDERCSRLVDEDRVNLVYDGIFESSLYRIRLSSCHVVAEIVEAKLRVGHVCDVCGVLVLSPVRRRRADDRSYRHAHEAEYPADVVRVTLCKVVVDRHDMDSPSCQRMKIRRH